MTLAKKGFDACVRFCEYGCVLSNRTSYVYNKETYRFGAQIVGIPKIVPSRPEVVSVDRHNFGVIPTDILSPRSDPEFDFLVGPGRQILGQLLNQGMTIDGHSHDIAKHHANHNRIPSEDIEIIFRLFYNALERVFEFGHKGTIGRRQTQYITPRLRLANDVANGFGKPIVVSVKWIHAIGARKGIPGRKLQIADNFALGDIPKLVVVVVVMASQDIVHGSSDVR